MGKIGLSQKFIFLEDKMDLRIKVSKFERRYERVINEVGWKNPSFTNVCQNPGPYVCWTIGENFTFGHYQYIIF